MTEDQRILEIDKRLKALEKDFNSKNPKDDRRKTMQEFINLTTERHKLIAPTTAERIKLGTLKKMFWIAKRQGKL